MLLALTLLGVFGVVHKAGETFGHGVKSVEAIFGADPRFAHIVLHHTGHQIVAETGHAVGFVDKAGEGFRFAVKQIQTSFIGADPEVVVFVHQTPFGIGTGQ